MICLLWVQAPGCQKSLQCIPKISICTTTYMWRRECIICCWNPIWSWHHLGLTASWPAGMCRSSICIIQLELSSPAMGGHCTIQHGWVSNTTPSSYTRVYTRFKEGHTFFASTCDFGALVWTWCSLHWTAGASCLVRQPVVVKGLGRSASIDAVGGAVSGWRWLSGGLVVFGGSAFWW